MVCEKVQLAEAKDPQSGKFGKIQRQVRDTTMARRLVASLLPLLTWGLGPRGAPALSRSQLIRGAGVGAYGALLVGILNAENSPDYQNAVRRTIARAVPRGGLRCSRSALAPRPTSARTARHGARRPRRAAPGRRLARVRRARAARRRRPPHVGRGRRGAHAVRRRRVRRGRRRQGAVQRRGSGAVVREVSRVLAPGGRFGFVEHVAADEGTVLERTQLLLDPLQQVVAGNCHLHRDTDRLIARSVGDPAAAAADSAALFSRAEAAERYIVWPMWPIAQQAAGVVVKEADTLTKNAWLTSATSLRFSPRAHTACPVEPPSLPSLSPLPAPFPPFLSPVRVACSHRLCCPPGPQIHGSNDESLQWTQDESAGVSDLCSASADESAPPRSGRRPRVQRWETTGGSGRPGARARGGARRRTPVGGQGGFGVGGATHFNPMVQV